MINQQYRQLSLVAFYGKKDTENLLWKKVRHIQSSLERYTNGNFYKYLPEKIHGTIIGLEGARSETGIINKNYLQNLNQFKEIDLENISKSIGSLNNKPIYLRFGGFKRQDKMFTSRGISPFERSFIIHNNTVIIIGWPYQENNYTPILNSLRRKFNQHGVMHKYHTSAESHDNDFYMTIGCTAERLEQFRIAKIQDLIREDMKSWENIELKLTKNDIKVIAYKDRTLKDVIPYEIDEVKKKIEELYQYYPDYKIAVKNIDWLV